MKLIPILSSIAITTLGITLTETVLATPEVNSHLVPEIAPIKGKKPTTLSQLPSGENSAQQLISPLNNQQFQLPTAEHLNRGTFLFKFGTRVFFFEGAIEDEETVVYPYAGFTWAITNSTELTFMSQLIDSGSPGNQGDFRVTSKSTSGDFFDLTLELKQRLFIAKNERIKLSGVVSLSWGQRGYTFRRDGVIVDQGVDDSIVPALALPLTAVVTKDLRFTISPTIAFFNDSNALYLHTPPIDNPGSFGTTFGLTTAISYSINQRLTLWGDAFFPMTGNNSINRESGRPDKAIAYNGGFRFLVNPKVALDIFTSNSYGAMAPLALTADRSFMSVGANLVFMPELFPANRRYADSFAANTNPEQDRLTLDGLGFFDGGTVPSRRFVLHLQGGTQGVMTALRYGIVRDVEIGVYLDYVASKIDESEQGISGKVRLLNQAEGKPLTVSVVATLGQTNQPFANFFSNNRNEFNERNLEREIPLIFNADNLRQGRLYITTISLPLHYQFERGAALWLTPVWGYVQRSGTEIAGFNVGGATPTLANISLIGEVGANFAGDGNTFSGDKLEDAIPWTFAVRWYPRGIESRSPLQLELYVTNRVGSSPWHQMRVRDQNDTAVGIGLSAPFSF
ncbi:hypothetical protein [Gloeocapsa sp. PCC 73106]|uniref:hypothetical protein n=1 Tax=Gloeocapsa sp. PCC 73106 TaxID=102232 RepID=UPI0002ABA8C7|nr:hypothetical protein [Gloeocapsa sp. PCC 73106]ELR98851.1 hypothetical protein GLO73106DRAFT_00026890 [Gloeocapsa sp. PCC 73106]